ncbi:Ribonuclease D [compost metagenome]
MTQSPATNTRYVDTPEELDALCAILSGCDRLAIDTEFIRERSYAPKLELIQIATPDGLVAVIDYARLGTRADAPFGALLTDPKILKVFHAADQDLEILLGVTCARIAPVFDTQIAAGLVGFGAKQSYGALVEATQGFRLAKGESMTDWSIRPLTAAQLDYAMDDVRYLLAVYDRLRTELTKRGRLDWAFQEAEGLQDNITSTLGLRTDPRTCFMRVKGRGGLDAQQLAVLRELAAWRENEAQRRDRPRGSVLKDELLVEIARRRPKHAGQLKNLRGIQPRDLERSGDDLVAAVAKALAMSRAEYPTPEPSMPAPDEQTLALTDLLQAVVHSVAARESVAASMLATNGELQRLADTFRRGERCEDLPVLSGWRGSLVGNDLLAVLEGRSVVAWNPKSQTLMVTSPQALEVAR